MHISNDHKLLFNVFVDVGDGGGGGDDGGGDGGFYNDNNKPQTFTSGF